MTNKLRGCSLSSQCLKNHILFLCSHLSKLYSWLRTIFYCPSQLAACSLWQLPTRLCFKLLDDAFEMQTGSFSIVTFPSALDSDVFCQRRASEQALKPNSSFALSWKHLFVLLWLFWGKDCCKNCLNKFNIQTSWKLESWDFLETIWLPTEDRSLPSETPRIASKVNDLT